MSTYSVNPKLRPLQIKALGDDIAENWKQMNRVTNPVERMMPDATSFKASE